MNYFGWRLTKMRNNRYDERIIEAKRKIAARGFFILLWGLMIILLYRQFYLGQTFNDYKDIFILWLLCSAYVAFGSSLTGISPYGGVKARLIIAPIVTAVTIVIVQYIMHPNESLLDNTLSFIIAFLASIAVLYFLYWLYIRWEKKNIDLE